MALGPRLDLRQSQQLVMTPQLQQAIKLLALTNLELEAAVSVELERNPLLESGDTDRVAESGEAEPLAAGDVGVDKMLETDPVGGQADAPLDMELGESVFHHDGAGDQPAAAVGMDGALGYSGAGVINGGGGFDENAPGFEALLTQDKSLQDHLRDQAGQTFADPLDRLIATHLADLVDDAGYISEPLTDIALRLGVAPGQVEAVLLRMQQFEPLGVCARSLAECLRIQAREADRLDPAMAMLLDHLDVLARGDMQALKRL